MLGNGGDDLLSGGAGKDTMSGGKGADTFFFSGALKEIDTVKDFGTGDMIKLDHGTFSSLGTGPLSQADFDDHFSYKHGKLSYDEDGAGGAKGHVFANFANKVHLDASDFLVG